MDVHHICCFIVFSIHFLFIFLLMIIFMFYRTTIMALVSPLFLASVASLTLAMTTIDATIKLLQQMKILPTSGTCSSCFSSSGSYKTDGLYHYFRCTTCKKKQSLLHNTVLSNSNTLLHDFVLREEKLPGEMLRLKLTVSSFPFSIINKLFNNLFQKSNLLK